MSSSLGERDSLSLLGQRDIHPRPPSRVVVEQLPLTRDRVAVGTESAPEPPGLAAHRPHEALTLLLEGGLVPGGPVAAEVLRHVARPSRVVADDLRPLDLLIAHAGVHGVDQGEPAGEPTVRVHCLDLDGGTISALTRPSLRPPLADQHVEALVLATLRCHRSSPLRPRHDLTTS